jgi:hypothetical protein
VVILSTPEAGHAPKIERLKKDAPDFFTEPTEDDYNKRKNARIAWAFGKMQSHSSNPLTIEKRKATVDDKRIEQVANQLLTPAERDRVVERKMGPTHTDFWSADYMKKVTDAGAVASFHNAYVDGAVATIINGGLKSSAERWHSGNNVMVGASVEADTNTGGANYIFSRILTQDLAKNRTFESWGYGDVAVVFKKEILGRMDNFMTWYDAYGNTDTLKYFDGLPAEMKKMSSGKQDGNSNQFCVSREVGNEWIDYFGCHSDRVRDEMLKKLRAEGVTTFNGRPIEQVVITRQHP